jgi:malonate semialdehyde decarboxylase
MPLLRFDLIEGRSEAEIKTHRAMLAAFTMPERDRYRHRACAVANDREDTGLGIPRTYTIVFLQVTSHERSQKQKEAFYRLLCEELNQSCGISPDDVVVAFVENGDEDWSFGRGKAQFLTGEL